MAETPRLTPTRGDAQTARRERLARALRSNLRRRKEQARERDAPPGELPPGADGDGERPA